MEYIILLIFSFFTEAVILWQYAASLFSPSHSGKETDSIKCSLCTVVFSFPAWANMAEYYQFFCDKHCFPLYNV